MEYEDTSNWPKVWGFIPVHPDGEISVWNFLLAHKELEDARERLHGNFLQSSANAVIGTIFVHHLLRALNIVRRNPRNIASWFCFAQCLAGILMLISNLSSTFLVVHDVVLTFGYLIFRIICQYMH
jgi:hypothetical protein